MNDDKTPEQVLEDAILNTKKGLSPISLSDLYRYLILDSYKEANIWILRLNK